MDYCEFMRYCVDYLLNNHNYSICNCCGGTGINAIMCCNGRDCGCYGHPVDFKLNCKECGRKHIIIDKL